MKTRPILFNGPMVNALLDGRKTMTRRIVKPQPNSGPGGEMVDLGGAWGLLDGDLSGEWVCPYGVPGDLLWVRETCTIYHTINHIRRASGASSSEVSDGLVGYRADGHGTIEDFRSHVASMSGSDLEAVEINGDRWRPSIHMPRWASRITLRITDVRVERVQDISEEDARAEGVAEDAEPCDHKRRSCEEVGCLGPGYRAPFAALWDTINGPDAWDRNDWVWCASFDVLKRNVDEVEAA